MRRKRWHQTDTKASVSVDHRGVLAIPFYPSLMNQEHRNPRLVERLKPDLFDLKHLWIKWDVGTLLEGVLESLSQGDTVFGIKKMKTKLQIVRLWLRDQRVDTARIRQFDFLNHISR